MSYENVGVKVGAKELKSISHKLELTLVLRSCEYSDLPFPHVAYSTRTRSEVCDCVNETGCNVNYN